jgi:hypothetical protein
MWHWKRNGEMFPEQTFLFRYKGWRRIAFVATLVLLLAGGEAHAAWTVQRTVDAATGQARCYLESTPMTVSDGYQDIQASIIVRADAVLIHTASPLDTSFTDIGMQVNTQTFVPMDEVSDRKSAVFTAQYSRLIAQFKQGGKVRAQLRFWPTWPVTGTHAVTFNLSGFSKAYAAMLACKE